MSKYICGIKLIILADKINYESVASVENGDNSL